MLLGFGISKYQLLENNGLLITVNSTVVVNDSYVLMLIIFFQLNYRNICSVTYCETVQGLYDVVEIYPQHPKFSEIRQYLEESQDLKGLLAILRRYFDYAIEFIDKHEK